MAWRIRFLMVVNLHSNVNNEIALLQCESFFRGKWDTKKKNPICRSLFVWKRFMSIRTISSSTCTFQWTKHGKKFQQRFLFHHTQTHHQFRIYWQHFTNEWNSSRDEIRIACYYPKKVYKSTDKWMVATESCMAFYIQVFVNIYMHIRYQISLAFDFHRSKGVQMNAEEYETWYYWFLYQN